MWNRAAILHETRRGPRALAAPCGIAQRTGRLVMHAREAALSPPRASCAWISRYCSQRIVRWHASFTNPSLMRHRLSVIGLALAAAIAILAPRLEAQGANDVDRPGKGDTSIFAPLRTQPPNDFRLADGEPGPRYWQQRADYDIRTTLDTARDQVTGELTLRYTNNSPVTLDHIWMQVEQNAFTDSSLNAYIFPQQSRFGGGGFSGGDVIDRFEQLTAKAGTKGGRGVPLKTRTWDTMLYVELAEPLAPGRSTAFNVAWHFRVPEHGADRMGHDGSLYEIAQWYPKVAVFDDVRGWNTDPYVGQGEFYLEYGDFTYAVTVPAGYIV